MLSWLQFEIADYVSHHVESDKILQIIPTVDQRAKPFEDTHSGLFSGHLCSAKVHSQLAKHFVGQLCNLILWSGAEHVKCVLPY